MSANPQRKYVVPDFAPHWTPRPVPGPFGFGMAECHLTPELADLFIQSQVEYQRNERGALTARYAADIGIGAWRTTHQGIAFNLAGKMTDGQHRCRAVIISGTPIDIIAFFGVGDRAEMEAFDNGGARKAIDAANVRDLDISERDIETVKALANNACGHGHVNLTHTQILNGVAHFATQLAALADWFSGARLKGSSRAPLRAAVLAASVNDHDPARLARFVGITTDRLAGSEPGDACPQLLKQWIVNKVNGGGGGMTISREMYLKTCNALRYYLARQNLEKLYACSDNPFPVAFPGLDQPGK